MIDESTLAKLCTDGQDRNLVGSVLRDLSPDARRHGETLYVAVPRTWSLYLVQDTLVLAEGAACIHSRVRMGRCSWRWLPWSDVRTVTETESLLAGEITLTKDGGARFVVSYLPRWQARAAHDVARQRIALAGGASGYARADLPVRATVLRREGHTRRDEGVADARGGSLDPD